MRGPLLFLKSFLAHPADVSSVIPTSRFAVKRVAAQVPQGAKVVVEYGPGTGVVSRELLKRLPRDGTLLLIEKTESLADSLREDPELGRDPRVRVICDSAENVRALLKDAGHAHADCILLSIPLSIMPPRLRLHILEETRKALAPGAPLVVFLFRPIIERYVKEVFQVESKEVEWRNIPPLRIFVAYDPEHRGHAGHGARRTH